jgi:hypothetical protein
MQQPPQGYDPNQYPQHQQHSAPGYQQPVPPQKQGMSTATKVIIGLLGAGVLFFGSCMVCVAIGAKGAADALEKGKVVAAEEKQAVTEARGEASTVQLETLLSEYKTTRCAPARRTRASTSRSRVRSTASRRTSSIRPT